MNKRRIFTWSVIIALGGFLFGLDTAVISGAEQNIQKLWSLNVFEHGLTVSIALIGTVVGAMAGGIPTDALGRKKTLFWIAVLFLVSAAGSALAIDWYTFLLFRFVGGLAVGCSSVTAPMYIGELAPASHRGRLVGMFQFNVVLGILIAFLSNYLLQDVGDNAWRWMLGVQAFPSILFLIAVLYLPESPRWLVVKQNKPEEALEVLALVNPETAERELRSIQHSHHSEMGVVVSSDLFNKKHQYPVWLAIIFAVFNQVSGINAIIYYAPRIFEMTGLGTSSALLSSVGLGLMNFIFTLLAMNFIDRYGRRTLMLVGSVGLIVTLGLVTNAFYHENFAGVPVFLFAYIAFFAFSQGAVIWVFISEIFPNEVRAKGQALGSFTHWLMATVIAFTFPYITMKLGGDKTFLLFTVMMILQLLFVWKVMPETKGKSLEQVSSSNSLHTSTEYIDTTLINSPKTKLNP